MRDYKKIRPSEASVDDPGDRWPGILMIPEIIFGAYRPLSYGHKILFLARDIVRLLVGYFSVCVLFSPASEAKRITDSRNANCIQAPEK